MTYTNLTPEIIKDNTIKFPSFLKPCPTHTLEEGIMLVLGVCPRKRFNFRHKVKTPSPHPLPTGERIKREGEQKRKMRSSLFLLSAGVHAQFYCSTIEIPLFISSPPRGEDYAHP
ncbi:MAG TPA: hypothetical protein PLW95_05225 [bacterium]|nr:hypothetical protein [bacterium]